MEGWALEAARIGSFHSRCSRFRARRCCIGSHRHRRRRCHPPRGPEHLPRHAPRSRLSTQHARRKRERVKAHRCTRLSRRSQLDVRQAGALSARAGALSDLAEWPPVRAGATVHHAACEQDPYQPWPCSTVAKAKAFGCVIFESTNELFYYKTSRGSCACMHRNRSPSSQAPPPVAPTHECAAVHRLRPLLSPMSTL